MIPHCQSRAVCILAPLNAWGVLLFAAAAGTALGYGYLPVAFTLGTLLPFPHPFGGAVFALAGAALLAHGRSRQPNVPLPLGVFAREMALPVLVAAIFGRWFLGASGPLNVSEVIWVCVVAPIAEELIFRGYLQRVFARRLGDGAYLSATNPIPASVGAAAIAFATWHWQNDTDLDPLRVGVQLATTFLLGLRFGAWNVRTGRVRYGMAGHALINAVAALAARL